MDGTRVSCEGTIYHDASGWSCVGDVGTTGPGRDTRFVYVDAEVDHVEGQWTGETS